MAATADERTLVWCTGISGSQRTDYVNEAAAAIRAEGRSVPGDRHRRAAGAAAGAPQGGRQPHGAPRRQRGRAAAASLLRAPEHAAHDRGDNRRRGARLDACLLPAQRPADAGPRYALHQGALRGAHLRLRDGGAGHAGRVAGAGAATGVGGPPAPRRGGAVARLRGGAHAHARRVRGRALLPAGAPRSRRGPGAANAPPARAQRLPQLPDHRDPPVRQHRADRGRAHARRAPARRGRPGRLRPALDRGSAADEGRHTARSRAREDDEGRDTLDQRRDGARGGALSREPYRGDGPAVDRPGGHRGRLLPDRQGLAGRVHGNVAPPATGASRSTSASSPGRRSGSAPSSASSTPPRSRRSTA